MHRAIRMRDWPIVADQVLSSTHAHTHVWKKNSYLSVCLFQLISVCMFVSIDICLYVCLSLPPSLSLAYTGHLYRALICVYTSMYIGTLIHTHTHTHTIPVAASDIFASAYPLRARGIIPWMCSVYIYIYIHVYAYIHIPSIYTCAHCVYVVHGMR
jgi:hypothetical protein